MLTRPLRLALVTTALLLALTAVILEGASLPHVHDDAGIYDRECALEYLATLGGVAPLPDGPPSGPPAAAVVAVLVPAPCVPDVPNRRHADSRAPPLV